IEMTNDATGKVAEPDLSVRQYGEAEWSCRDACARCGYRPHLDRARCRIESPNPPTSCCCKPEVPRGIELEILGSHLTAMHGAEGKGAKRVPYRIKASDIVCALLDEPDVALCVYCRRHEAIFRVGGDPGLHH